MTAADLARERDRTRRDAWNGASFIIRRAIVAALGWPDAFAWLQYDHLNDAQRIDIARASLTLADAVRSVSDVALARIAA